LLKIVEKDLIFGRVIKTIVDNCPVASTVLLRESRKEVLSRLNQGCRTVVQDETGLKVLYDDLCPLRRFREGFQFNFPYFLGQWRVGYWKINEEQRKVYSVISLIGIGVLFSLNNQQIPRGPTQLAEDFLLRFGNPPDDYAYWIITRKLEELNWTWLQGLQRLAVNQDLHKDTWRRIIFLLGLFLEVMQPIQPLTEEDKNQFFDSINQFLFRGK